MLFFKGAKIWGTVYYPPPPPIPQVFDHGFLSKSNDLIKPLSLSLSLSLSLTHTHTHTHTHTQWHKQREKVTVLHFLVCFLARSITGNCCGKISDFLKCPLRCSHNQFSGKANAGCISVADVQPSGTRKSWSFDSVWLITCMQRQCLCLYSHLEWISFPKQQDSCYQHSSSSRCFLPSRCQLRSALLYPKK